MENQANITEIAWLYLVSLLLPSLLHALISAYAVVLLVYYSFNLHGISTPLIFVKGMWKNCWQKKFFERQSQNLEI
jgi:hypothetical protein